MTAKGKKSATGLTDLTMSFGDDVHWGADGPAFDRSSDHKGASVELQGDYDSEDGRARAIIFVAKGGLAQATFKPGRDINFSHEMDGETQDKAWKLADQLVAILDIRAAAMLAKDGKSARIDKTALLAAVQDIDPAYIPKDQLIALHDDLAALGSRGAAAKEIVLKAISVEAENAARETVKSARAISAEFKKVAIADESAADDALDRLSPQIGQVDAALPFLRREFLTAASAERTGKALSLMSATLGGLTGGNKAAWSSFTDKVKAQAQAFGVS
jgi:hypothetical protein